MASLNILLPLVWPHPRICSGAVHYYKSFCSALIVKYAHHCIKRRLDQTRNLCTSQQMLCGPTHDITAVWPSLPCSRCWLAGARFRLLLLAVQHCRQTQQHQRYQHGQTCKPQIAVLFDRIMATALQTFRAPPAWYGKWQKHQAR